MPPLRHVAGAPALSEGTAGVCRIPKRGGGGGPAPLSFAQERLWFLQSLHPEGCAYNLCGTMEINGPFDLGSFGGGLRDLVGRHEALRTTFPLSDGRPGQLIHQAPDPRLRLIVAEGAPQEWRRVAHQASTRPFALSEEPPWRVCLFQSGAGTTHVFFVIHHIIADAWSVLLFRRELEQLYAGRMTGRPALLPEVEVQYADFAEWQRNTIEGEGLRRDLDFWTREIEGAVTEVEWPMSRPRPLVQTSRGRACHLRLPHEVGSAAGEMARSERVTMFTLLLAVFQILLGRYLGRAEILCGTPVSTRGRVELEPVMGLFINTLLIRSDLSGNPSFRQFLHRLRSRLTALFEHQDAPFERVVQELGVRRDLSRTPLSQVLFTLQVAAEGGAPEAAPEVSAEAHSSRVDLEACFTVSGSAISALFIYNEDLFERAAISRLARQYEQLLREALRAPDSPVHRYPLREPGEERGFLAWWNSTGNPSSPGLVHGMVEAQAAREPDAVALISGQDHLSYFELNRRADRVASALLARGVEREARVGICLPRDRSLIETLLGVLKAGCAYVPLDLIHPPAKRLAILRDSGAALLVTSARLISAFEGYAGEMLVADDLVVAASGGGERVTRRPMDPDNLANVIYTSGSTGEPKGIQVTHGALANFLLGVAEQPGFSADVRMLALTTIVFDIAALEILLPLSVGGVIILETLDLTRDPRKLVDSILERQVNVTQATPSTWRILLEAGWNGGPGTRALCGGESWGGELAGALIESGTELWNMYGPTETAVWSTAARIERTDVPIVLGKPLQNTQVYILDPDGLLVPLGVPGELHIGGEGLARGYINRPDATAAAFVPNPFGAGSGRRLYATGDLVRYLPNGRMEFAGRKDHQLKIRGVRLEPGEIEAALRAHPRVDQAMVRAVEDSRRTKRLVAYFTFRGADPVTAAELRVHLGGLVAPNLVPDHFVPLTAFPLTASGKVDRKALPSPEVLHETASTVMVPPSTAPERVIAEIWGHVLGRDVIGVHENFFEAGGNSLTITLAHLQMTRRFARKISLVDMFQHPTIAALARFVADDALGGPARVDAAASERLARMPEVRRSRERRRSILSERTDVSPV